MDVAKRLRMARDLAGKTQTQVSKDTGINNKTLSGYERGVSEPDLSTFQLLADYYSVSIDYLLGRTDEVTSMAKEQDEEYYINDDTRKIAQEIKDNPELRALFDASRNASPEDLEITKNLILNLKKKERGE